MADNSNHILNQLQQLNMEPPADAFEKAWQRIVQNERTAEGNVADADRGIFAQLQQHELAPPPLDFSSISTTTEQKQTRVIPAYWLRAAAVLLLFIAGTVLYFTVFSKKESTAGFSATPAIIKDSANTTAENKIADTGNKEIAVAPARLVAVATTEVPQKKTTSNDFERSTKKTGTVDFSSGEAKLYENDVLLTLVNYKSRDWEIFFIKAVTEKKITLNKYSYHNLSDKMVEMLQDTYLTKRNGKPTRKARKTSRKFEKWRKKDEKYFDKDLQKNPADIIDLSEFILKKN